MTVLGEVEEDGPGGYSLSVRVGGAPVCDPCLQWALAMGSGSYPYTRGSTHPERVAFSWRLGRPSAPVLEALRAVLSDLVRSGSSCTLERHDEYEGAVLEDARATHAAAVARADAALEWVAARPRGWSVKEGP